MSKIFQDQPPPMTSAPGVAVDSKLRRKLREKKIAMGHKADESEQTM